MWHNHFGSACSTNAGQLCQPGCGAPAGCAGFSVLESCEGEAGLFLCTHKDPPAARKAAKAGKKKITKAAKASKKSSPKKTKKAPKKAAKRTSTAATKAAKPAKKAAPKKRTPAKRKSS